MHRILRNHITLLATITLAFVLHTNIWGQTYTYTAGPDCNGTWSDGDCWTVTANNDPDGCTGSTNPTPPTNPSAGCKIDVIINDAVTFSGSPSFGGSFSSITFEAGGSLNITGTATFKNGSDVQFYFEEANQSINIGGGLVIESNGSLESFGAPRATDEKISNYIVAGSLSLSSKSNLFIDENAGILVNGTFNVHTPSNKPEDYAMLTIDGFFEVENAVINGNSHLVVEVSEEAERVYIRQSLEMKGNSSLVFRGDADREGGDEDGDSHIDIGGGIINSAGSKALITADDATLHICGSFTGNFEKKEEREGIFLEESCRTLPVIWYDVDASLDTEKRAAEVIWSTAKEWETSHYVVERSLDGIDDFRPIGEVPAMGWADTLSEYKFRDSDLPNQGKRIYYRIQQLDMDGTYEYSKTVSISVPAQEETGKNWRAFPNPTQGNQLTLSLQNGLNYGRGPVTVRLYTPSLSSPILSTTLASVTAPIELDQLIMHAPKGLLIVEVNWGGHMERIKVLKQ